jgi:hypothetical protein
MIIDKNVDTIKEILDVPVQESCDVLVAGGGTAGAIAAIAAARNGAKTILLEENTFLGGAILAGGVILMGYYNTYKPYGIEPIQLIKGLGDELRQKLQEQHGSTGFYEEAADPVHESMGIHSDRVILPHVLLEMILDAGVILHFKTRVVNVIMEEKTIKGVVAETQTGRKAYIAKVVIDTTGNATVAYKAGVPCVDHPKRKSGGLAFGLANMDFEKVRRYATEKGSISYLGYASKGGKEKDKITRIGFKLKEMEDFKQYYEKPDDYCFHVEPCIISNRENHASMVNGVTMDFDTANDEEVSKATIKLNTCVYKMAKLLKEKFPGFEDSYVDWISPLLGVRFVRQVVCEYDISQEHIFKGVIPEDTIGLYGVEDAHFLGYDIKGGYYGIPYRALVPKKIDNLLVAGKMITSDWVVWMSTRLTGACFLQGQAVGTAAAIAAKNGIKVRDVNAVGLRQNLKRDGVFLN